MLGYAFVHHLSNLDLFFKEVDRVLKKGGLCLFMDDAYSNIWHKLKFSPIIKPLYSHFQKKHWVSPEDLKASIKGGFRKEEIELLQKKYNFVEMKFIRFELLSYIYSQGLARFLGISKIRNLNKNITLTLYHIDRFIQNRSRFYHNNTVRLIWGFKK